LPILAHVRAADPGRALAGVVQRAASETLTGAPTTENGGLSWPRCGGLIWPHFRPIAGRASARQRARREAGRRDGFQSGAVRADPQGSRSRGPVDPGARRAVSGAPADGASGVGVAGAAAAQAPEGRQAPALGECRALIDEWLLGDLRAPCKQRHTAAAERHTWQPRSRSAPASKAAASASPPSPARQRAPGSPEPPRARQGRRPLRPHRARRPGSMPIPALCREVPEVACRAPEPSSKDRHNSRTARERNSAGDRLAPHCGSRAIASTGACSSSQGAVSRAWDGMAWLPTGAGAGFAGGVAFCRSVRAPIDADLGGMPTRARPRAAWRDEWDRS
jgi:hypothetical protein